MVAADKSKLSKMSQDTEELKAILVRSEERLQVLQQDIKNFMDEGMLRFLHMPHAVARAYKWSASALRTPKTEEFGLCVAEVRDNEVDLYKPARRRHYQI